MHPKSRSYISGKMSGLSNIFYPQKILIKGRKNPGIIPIARKIGINKNMTANNPHLHISDI